MASDYEQTEAAAVPLAGTGKGAGRVLPLLLLLNLFHFVDRSMLVIAIEPIRAEFALDDFSLSLLTGAAYSVPYALALIPLGILADRADRARLLTVLLALFSLSSGLIGLAGSVVALVVARMAIGASEAGVVPASVSLLADRYGAADRSRAFGLFFLASGLGTIVSFGLGGQAMELFGWRLPFLVAAAAGLATAAVLAVFLRDEARGAARSSPADGRVEGFGRLFRQPRLLALWFGGAFATAMLVGFWAWSASLFQREFGFSVGEAGALLALGAGVAAGLGTYAAGWLHTRLRPVRPMLAARLPAILSVVSAVAVVATSSSEHRLAAMTAFVVASFLLPMYLPVAFALGSEAVPPQASARHAAVQQFANNAFGAALGPALVGAISAATGSLRTGMIWLAGAGILSAICFLGIASRPAAEGWPDAE